VSDAPVDDDDRVDDFFFVDRHTGVRVDRETGEARLASVWVHEDGKPIPPGGEICKARPAEGRPGVLEVRTIYKHAGPARVSTKLYEDGWDRIFKKEEAN